jgi:hypothetical protein
MGCVYLLLPVNRKDKHNLVKANDQLVSDSAERAKGRSERDFGTRGIWESEKKFA